MIQIGPSRAQIFNLHRLFAAPWVALLLLWAVLFVPSFTAHAAPQSAPFAAVVAVAGKPTFARGTLPRPLSLRQSLSAGDIIETGTDGKVSILFSDGSQVRLGPGSRLQITEPVPIKGRTSFFRVIAGEVWARLRPGRGVQTQYSSLVVRGTDIHLAVANDGSATLTVLEGEVQFASDFGEVIVHTSEQSVVHPGAAPTKPITVANPGLIVEWTLDLNRAALPREKSWTGLTGPALAKELTRSDALERMTDTAAQHLHLGDVLFDSHEYQDALVRYNMAALAAPADAVVALHRGYALLELGQLSDAAAAFAPATPEAQTGAAWVALEREAPTEAERLAKLAVAGNAQSAEAHLVLALALMRQPGRATEAEAELRTMLNAQPATLQPQAHAWLAVLALAQDDAATATTEAALAVKQAPYSALAQSSAASVAFYSGRTDAALKAANRAAELNPASTATLIALGQAQLADGNVEKAAATAARAVALDPESAQAYYLLGVADAQRQDYAHAARELRTALRLSPDYFAAAGLLARVYVRMDRPAEANTLLADMAKRHPESDTLLAATGETLYAQGKYKDALEQYRSAVKVRPNSALAWNGLARLALDANQLSEAIRAGQRATDLAPHVSLYHSTLGLAYSYSGLDRQAEREFRTALAHDPNNAIALVKLGLASRDGDARVTNRTLGLSFAQGFLLDPEVSRDLFRGGTHTELEARPTSDGLGGSLANRTVALDGKVNAFTNLVSQNTNGPRNNDDTKLDFANNDTTYSPRPGTTIYLHAQSRRERDLIPGADGVTDPDDRLSFGVNESILALKQRMDDRATLWAGLSSFRQRSNGVNPNQDYSDSFVTPSPFVTTTNIIDQRSYSRSLSPEFRIDYKFSKSARSNSLLTLGAARPRSIRREETNLVLPGPPGFPGLPGSSFSNRNIPERIEYIQASQQFGERASLIAQLRDVHYNFNDSSGGTVGGFINFDTSSKTSRSFLLPSMVGNLKVSEKDQLRLLAGRRKTEFSSSIFAPVATLLTTEPQTLFNGYSDPVNGDTHVYELDAEHRFGTGRLLKVFLFHSTGRHVVSDYSQYFNSQDLDIDGIPESNAVQLDRVRRAGLGARYEHQLGNSLFGQVGLAYNRTKGEAAFFDPGLGAVVPAFFNGQQAPYQPRLNADLGLNYITRSGNKAGLFVNHTSSMFADIDDPRATSRPRFGGKTTFDLQLARERTVKQQILFRVNNIFNAHQIAYNGVQIGQRRLIIEATRRF